MTHHLLPQPTPGLCGCGCGAPVPRRYRPGHDAKHKGILSRACSSPRADLRDAAVATMMEHGWHAWVPTEPAHLARERDRSGRAKLLLSEVTLFLVDPDGCHHSHVRCHRMTESAKRHGQVHPVSKLIRPTAYTTSATHPGGWDWCEACCQDETPAVTCERTEIRRQQWLAAYDLESALRKGFQPQITPPRPEGWRNPSHPDNGQPWWAPPIATTPDLSLPAPV